jgi:hypothetical protein
LSSRCLLALCAFAAGACVAAPSAWGAWAGSDPSANFPPGTLPTACAAAPTGTACINAGIYFLDEARASLGQLAYKLPADFPSLTPAQQTFILTNLDRVLYGLPPITGLTAALNGDAGVAVAGNDDPAPSDTNELNGWTGNWAGGYLNVVLAYEGWMFDDGLGSPNVTCTPQNADPCWGHRHDVLWEFAGGDVLAMGAASGSGLSGLASYAMVLVGGYPADGGDPGYQPSYTYTWAQAVADGAGTNAYDPGVPQQPAPDCVVPSLRKKPLAAAKRLLAGAHCRVGKIVKRTSKAKRGTVLAQGYRAGARLPSGSKVDLLVSRGRG